MTATGQQCRCRCRSLKRKGHVAAAAKKADAFFLDVSLNLRALAVGPQAAGLFLPWPGKARSPTASSLCFQLRSKSSPMPSLRAASATEKPWTVISLTATRLKSRA